MDYTETYELLFKEVGKNQLELSLDQQLNFLRLYQETFDPKHADVIVKSNLKLIMGICKKFLRNVSPDQPIYMDIHSEAFKEAVDCLKRYAFGKGNCTVPSWIRNNVYRKITAYVKTNKHVIKYTPIVHDRIDLHNKAQNAFYTQNERWPIAGDEVSFLYKGKRHIYEFKKEYENPTFLSEYQVSSSDSENEYSIFDLIKQEDENLFFFEEQNYKKNILKTIIEQLPYRQKQIMRLVYYEGYKIMDINTKMTPLNKNELDKAERNSNNTLYFNIKGKKQKLDVYVADYDIIDVQKRDKNFSFLLNDKYYTNSERLIFYISENIDISYNGDIYKGTKWGDKYRYEMFLEKKMNPAIVRMSVDLEHKEALNNIKTYILKNKLLSSLK